jgi:hypothetical protein
LPNDVPPEASVDLLEGLISIVLSFEAKIYLPPLIVQDPIGESLVERCKSGSVSRNYVKTSIIVHMHDQLGAVIDDIHAAPD